MAVKRTKRKLPDTYFALVKQFPLAHIRDEGQLIAAQAMLDQLLTQRLDAGAEEYLDALTDLVENYEDKNIELPDASEADVLSELMSSNGLTQAKLAKKTGISQSTISAVLNGVRSLTKEQIITLGKLFHVSPSVFLPS
jgi:HTH-type transcriptional regulator/antitoxin HigA